MIYQEGSCRRLRHLAIIMDGNGRWAQARGLHRIFGHREGARNVTRTTVACVNRGIEILTLYGFSVENWARPAKEIDLLFKLLKVYTHVGKRLCLKHNVRFRTLGNIEAFPDFLKRALRDFEEVTAKSTGMLLQIALNYGSRDEITRVTRALAKRVEEGTLKVDDIDENLIHHSLDTEGQCNPDLVVRTSGEYRLSNYLLWQSAYSELYFCKAHWPEFNEDELDLAIDSFSQRERRFGGIQTPVMGSQRAGLASRGMSS